MLRLTPHQAYACARHSRFEPLTSRLPPPLLLLSQSFCRHRSRLGHGENDHHEHHMDKTPNEGTAEDGAMSRRLRDLTEESLELSGRGVLQAVSEAGFSEELRKQLEERIASANFRQDHRNAFAEAELPSSAGKATRDVTTADPWLGEESLHDANLRMLDDAHKPLRRENRRFSGPAASLPGSINTGRKPKGVTGTRLANARDRSGLYSSLKESPLSEQEREQRFRELKERFSPHGRTVVPGTVQGLASLANERIEDAIARGQFKNLPRGKQIERDYTASSPFLDTTEYFMNKIIQKQDIVPPWIEKQQELASTANKFRARLRNDWRRHAARMIASKGGTLLEQMKRAEVYAEAELAMNSSYKKLAKQDDGDSSNRFSKISPSGELQVSPSPPESVESSTQGTSKNSLSNLESEHAVTAEPSTARPAPQPFRDPHWEATESAYLNLSITELNSLTRSYNLQAPNLAKKPYFSLTRELNACYAEVAPQLAEAIRQRALAPKARITSPGFSTADGVGVMDKLVGSKVKVRDEKVEKRYGLKQFWNDVFGKGKA